jgi:hypothetical protein
MTCGAKKGTKMSLENEQIIKETQDWLEKAVIGLNLCPFAKAVHVKQQIRYVVSKAKTEAALLDDLLQELDFLMASDPEVVDTTLLIHPWVLTDFLDYNDFLDVADGATAEPEFNDALQIASFHPQYQFADTEVDDIANFTNRSPYPMLHLLREDSIDRAVAAFPEADAIYEKNMQTLRELGLAGWKKLMAT